MKPNHKGYLFILLAVFELSLLPIVSSTGGKSIPILSLLFFVFLTASFTSFLILLYKKKFGALGSLMSDRKNLAIIAMAGLLNYALAQLFLTMGVIGTNPAIASIILKLWPIFMALMLPFALKTKIKKGQIIALIFAFAGVYLLLTNGNGISTNLKYSYFIFFIVLSTISTAVSNVIIRGHNYDTFCEVFIFNFSSFLLITSIILISGTQLVLNLNTTAIASVLFLGIITYSIGAFLFFYALKAFNPLLMANATYLTPFITFILTSVLLKTQLLPYYFYSLALIITALLIQSRYAVLAPERRTRKWKFNKPVFDVTGALLSNEQSEIYDYIKGDGRALAMEVDPHFNPSEINLIAQKRYLLFSNKQLHPDIKEEQMKFIEQIMGIKEGETIIVGIGKPDIIEEILRGYQ